MIERHQPDGFIPIHFKRNGDCLDLEIDTDNYMTLTTYLERSVLSDEGLASLIATLIKPIEHLERFYLDSSFVSLQLSNLYYDFQKKEVVLLYGTTEKHSSKIEERLKTLVRELVYEHARLEVPNSEFISTLLSYLKEPGWHIKGLVYLLNEQIEYNGSPKKSGKVEVLKHLNMEDAEKSKVIINHPNQDSDRKLDHKADEKLDEKSDIKKSIFRKDVDLKNFKIGFLIALAGFLFGFIRTLSFSSSEKIGLILILGALIGIVIIRILKSSNAELSKNKKVTEVVNPHALEGKKSSIFEVRTQKDSHSEAEDRTVIAKKVELGFALSRQAGHKIPLNKDIIIIGRQEGVADILIDENASVGRQHAKLIKIDSSYAVKDLKSINGTYVNDKKVAPDQPIALMDGDVLIVSDERFTFHSIR